MTLSSSLGFNASEIQYVSYLGLVRLATDSIDLNWLGNGVVQVSFDELEIVT